MADVGADDVASCCSIARREASRICDSSYRSRTMRFLRWTFCSSSGGAQPCPPPEDAALLLLLRWWLRMEPFRRKNPPRCSSMTTRLLEWKGPDIPTRPDPTRLDSAAEKIPQEKARQRRDRHKPGDRKALGATRQIATIESMHRGQEVPSACLHGWLTLENTRRSRVPSVETHPSVGPCIVRFFSLFHLQCEKIRPSRP